MRAWWILVGVGVAGIAAAGLGVFAYGSSGRIDCLREPAHSGQKASYWTASLGDADREVRLAAAQALVEVAGPDLGGFVPDVLDRLADERDPEIAKLLGLAVSRSSARARSPKVPRFYCG